jgi:hypothetical protein
MTHEPKPTPILDDPGASPELRELLRVARDDMPDAEKLDRLAKRLAPMVGIAGLSGGEQGFGTAPANPPGYAPTLAPVGKVAAVKVGTSALLKGVAAAFVIAGASSLWLLPATPRAPQSEVQRAAPASVREPQAGPAEPQVEPAIEAAVEATPPPPDLVERTRVEKPAARPRPARASKVEPALSPSPPSELDLIRRAETLRGSPARLLAVLDEHARFYPDGMLAQEREVLAIEALVAEGQRGAAEQRASRMAQRYPGSAHLRRVRVLLDRAPQP